MAGAAISFNSANNSTESPAKLLTKLRGFLISWAMPAVSWPKEAIFSCTTSSRWAERSRANAVSASSRARSSSCWRCFMSVTSV